MRNVNTYLHTKVPAKKKKILGAAHYDYTLDINFTISVNFSSISVSVAKNIKITFYVIKNINHFLKKLGIRLIAKLFCLNVIVNVIAFILAYKGCLSCRYFHIFRGELELQQGMLQL